MLEYQRVLNTRRNASDPWGELANAIVEQAADDYRRNMTKRIKRGLSMSDLELRMVDSHILEIKQFFESSWGSLLSHGLAPVIWEKLQKEFAADNAKLEAALARKREEQKAKEKEEAALRAAPSTKQTNKQKSKKEEKRNG